MRPPARTKIFAAAIMSTSLLLTGCGAQDGMRVESSGGLQDDAPPPTAPPTADTAPIFPASEVRLAVLDDDSLTNIPGYSQVYEILAYCQDCITLTETLHTDDRTYQLATVSPPGDDADFAGLAVEDAGGEPRIKLLVTGHDLSFRAGQHGTIVAQENIFRSGDPECCPSGWSVQVFRYRAGSFVAGQRVGEL